LVGGANMKRLSLFGSPFLAAGLLASIAFSQSASADTVDLNQSFTGNVAQYGAPTPSDPTTGLFEITSGSVPNSNLSPYAFNSNYTSVGVNWNYDALDAGGGPSSTAIFNLVSTDTFTLLWGSPDTYNTVTLWSGPNGTGTQIATYNGGDLACYSTSCKDTLYDLVTFTDVNEDIGSIVLNDSGQAAFEFGLDPTPLPASLPLFASGLFLIGLLAWRRKSRALELPVAA
jgi:hypothetical protein